MSEEGRCRLFHAWTRWSGLKNGNALWAGKKIGEIIWQDRHCTRCNKAQIREVHR